MTEELVEWGRACIYIRTWSLTWICRLSCGIAIYRAGRLPPYPFLPRGVSPVMGCWILTKAIYVIVSRESQVNL